MRRHADTVDAGHRADVMRHGDNARHRVFLTNDVRAVRKTDKLHPVVEYGRKAVQLQLPAFGIDMPFPDFHAAVREPSPGAAVCFMVLVGDDHRVPLLQRLGEGLREDIGVLTCRRAEAQLVRCHIHHGGKPLAGLVHFIPARRTCRVMAVGLHLALRIEPMKPVNHLTAGIGPAGILEEGLSGKARLGKGRELASDEFDIKLCHDWFRSMVGRVLQDGLREPASGPQTSVTA